MRKTSRTSSKIETHNHPTAIAPHPGAGTGAGGEIATGATGTGRKTRQASRDSPFPT
jgi:phosphoribosylformylglycinamidine synthase